MIRPNDIPRSFYPGMWLRRVEEGAPYTHPTAEVVRVGRKRVTIHGAGLPAPGLFTVEEAQRVYRKVYASEPPAVLPAWIKEGAEFRADRWDVAFRVRQIRWSCASVETTSGVLMFWTLEALARLGVPRRSTWDHLLEDEC